MKGLTWNKAAGGGIGAAVASYVVEALDKASIQYLSLDIPELAEMGLLILLTGLITYYTPANVLSSAPTDSSKSGV